MKHIPVLINDFLSHIEQMEKIPETYLDCTFGRGGHFAAIKKGYPNITADLIDRDPQAIRYAQEVYGSDPKVKIHHLNFMRLKEEATDQLKNKRFDIILADLGVSSPQLDEPKRGFSFYQDGPLDMRMDNTQGVNAADIVNQFDSDKLTSLFKELGEIRSPHKVVERIIETRKEKKISTTNELSELIVKTVGWKKKGSHPATQYFLALRLKVNEELALLEEASIDLIHRLKPYGRLFVMTFHSSEDRIVKWTFKRNSSLGKVITKKAIQAKWSEKKANPRARSAILRIFERGCQ